MVINHDDDVEEETSLAYPP